MRHSEQIDLFKLVVFDIGDIKLTIILNLLYKVCYYYRKMDNDVNDIMDIHDIHVYYRPRIVRRRERIDPFNLPDREFKARYRFSKDGVRNLTDILRPHLNADAENNRGLPFSSEKIAFQQSNKFWQIQISKFLYFRKFF